MRQIGGLNATELGNATWECTLGMRKLRVGSSESLIRVLRLCAAAIVCMRAGLSLLEICEDK